MPGIDPNSICPHCRRWKAAAAVACERCERFVSIGTIVDGLGPAVFPQVLDALEAVAVLCLIQPADARRRRNRELFLEQRETQRSARSAYDDGYAEGARRGRG